MPDIDPGSDEFDVHLAFARKLMPYVRVSNLCQAGDSDFKWSSLAAEAIYLIHLMGKNGIQNPPTIPANKGSSFDNINNKVPIHTLKVGHIVVYYQQDGSRRLYIICITTLDPQTGERIIMGAPSTTFGNRGLQMNRGPNHTLAHVKYVLVEDDLSDDELDKLEADLAPTAVTRKGLLAFIEDGVDLSGVVKKGCFQPKLMKVMLPEKIGDLVAHTDKGGAISLLHIDTTIFDGVMDIFRAQSDIENVVEFFKSYCATTGEYDRAVLRQTRAYLYPGANGDEKAARKITILLQRLVVHVAIGVKAAEQARSGRWKAKISTSLTAHDFLDRFKKSKEMLNSAWVAEPDRRSIFSARTSTTVAVASDGAVSTPATNTLHPILPAQPRFQPNLQVQQDLAQATSGAQIETGRSMPSPQKRKRDQRDNETSDEEFSGDESVVDGLAVRQEDGAGGIPVNTQTNGRRLQKRLRQNSPEGHAHAAQSRIPVPTTTRPQVQDQFATTPINRDVQHATARVASIAAPMTSTATSSTLASTRDRIQNIGLTPQDTPQGPSGTNRQPARAPRPMVASTLQPQTPGRTMANLPAPAAYSPAIAGSWTSHSTWRASGLRTRYTYGTNASWRRYCGPTTTW